MCSALEFGLERGLPKKSPNSQLDDWESVHMEMFLYKGVAWSPCLSEPWCSSFRPRSAEVVYFANYVWPAKELDKWEYFDTNHDAKRIFRWPLKPNKKGEMSKLKCPWRLYIPTFTALSNVVARQLHTVPGQDAILILRHVHPIEAMRVMGWDLEHYRDGPFKWVHVPGDPKQVFLDADLLGDLVGNAWCAWTFCSIKIALAGAAPWQKLFQMRKSFEFLPATQKRNEDTLK